MKEELHPSVAFGLPEGVKGFAPHALVYSDGLYRLFFGRASFPYGFSKCSLSLSENLLDWKDAKDILTPGFFEPIKIGAGSAIHRNGKTAYFYTQKTPFSSVIRMATTPDYGAFERFPLPVIAKKDLPKKARGVGAPRVFKSGEDYYIAAGSAAGTLLFQSRNLMNWRLRGTLPGGVATDFASLVQSGNRHILFETRAGGVFGYRYGRVRPEEGVFTVLKDFTALDTAVSPRVTTLPDGRLVLTAGLLRLDGGCDALAIPKEIIAAEEGLRLLPVRETLARRQGEITAAVSCGETTAAYSELSGTACELLITAHLKNAKSFTARLLMTGCRGLFITFDRENGNVVFDASTLSKTKNLAPVVRPYAAGDTAEMRILLLPGRAECFIDGGALTFSRGYDAALAGSGTGFDAKGHAFCEAVKYDLK